MTRQSIVSPDRDTFLAVSKLLSTRAVSVAASSNTRLTHIVTSLLSPKTLQELEALGATIGES